MRPVIRLANHTDLDDIARTRALAWAETYPGLIPSTVIEAQVDRVPAVVRHLQQALDDGLSVWVAIADGAIVGHAHATISDDPNAAQPLELASLYLLRRAQGIGLGRRLLFTALGDSPGQLWVLESNERAIRFYRTAGFEADGARRKVAPAFEGAEEIRMVRG